MIIRKTTETDIPIVMEIYAEARQFMRESGNPNQWRNTNPSPFTVAKDVNEGKSYVALEDGEIAAVFYFAVEEDPTYFKIDGAWLNDAPYGVVHRIAKRRTFAEAGKFCLEWCFNQCGNLRIDTHSDNAPMRRVLEKLNFAYCGTIYLSNGDPRMAFQKS